MIRVYVLREIATMTLRDFTRTPEAVFWSYGFPLIMALVLGFAFSRGEVPRVDVGIVGGGHNAAAAEALKSELSQHAKRPINCETIAPKLADRRLARGGVDLLLVQGGEGAVEAGGATWGLRFDPTRPESELARTVVEIALLDREFGPLPKRRIEPVTEPGGRYIDFLIPGLIGLNLLGSGLFGIGFGLVQMRVNKMLRRLAVTPMRRSEFLVAFLIGRLLLTVPETAVLVVFGIVVFGVPMQLTSLPLFVLLVFLGATAFSGLGLLVATRARSIEAVSGLMNLAMVPMWLLGGCFFSVENFPDELWPVIACVPMYWQTESLRDVMLWGEGIGTVWLAVVMLAAWAFGTIGLSIRLFRWQ